METARDYLTYYMQRAWQAAGIGWDGDNEAEVATIIDCIEAEIDRKIKAALEEVDRCGQDNVKR